MFDEPPGIGSVLTWLVWYVFDPSCGWMVVYVPTCFLPWLIGVRELDVEAVEEGWDHLCAVSLCWRSTVESGINRLSGYYLAHFHPAYVCERS